MSKQKKENAPLWKKRTVEEEAKCPECGGTSFTLVRMTDDDSFTELRIDCSECDFSAIIS